MNKIATLLSLGCTFATSLAAADSEVTDRQFNLRVNPLIIAIGGNFDLDFFVTPNLSVGPSFFGWAGGFSSRRVPPDGSQSTGWTAYGLRSNYYFDIWRSSHLVCVGPGFYQANKTISYQQSGKTLTGEVSGLAATSFVGYLYQTERAFNFSAGIVGLYFLNKANDISVTNENTKITISSGPSTQLLLEASVGLRF